MAATPITITLYDENNEVKAEFQRLIIPWGMLKRALKFKGLDENSVDENMFDELGAFVCELFGNKFTLDDLSAGADISEVFAVINAVAARAAGYFAPNPPAGK